MSSLSPAAPTKEFTVLMAALMSLVAISIDALLPALGIVSTDLNLANPNHAQYLIVFLFVGMALGQLMSGPLSDAWGRKKLLYAGITLYLVGSVVCLFADTLNIMLAGRFIQGLGVSAPYISAVSIVRDRYSGRHMARVMSIVMMIFIMVPAIAPSLGQGIMLYADWRDIFILYILYALAITAWIYSRLPETLPPEKRVPFTAANLKHGFREVIGNRATALYTVCMGICFGSFLGYLNSSQQIFQDRYQTGEMFVVYFGLLALVMGASSLTNSRLVEKLGMQYMCVRAFMSIVITSGLFLLLHVIVEDVTLWMFLGYAAILFFSFGLVFGNLNALAMEPMGHIAGMASAVIGFMSSMVSMSIGAGIGQLYNGTLIPMTLGFFCLGSVAVGILFLADKARRRAYHRENPL